MHPRSEGDPFQKKTTHQYIAVIIESVQANLRQQYPTDRFELIVIADSIQPAVLTQLAELPIRIIPVSFETSTVSKAINAALEQIPAGQYDVLMVADADNHMATDFLQRINLAFDNGWRAVQGHRVAKNTNTSVAIFDAMNPSELPVRARTRHHWIVLLRPHQPRVARPRIPVEAPAAGQARVAGVVHHADAPVGLQLHLLAEPRIHAPHLHLDAQ